MESLLCCLEKPLWLFGLRCFHLFYLDLDVEKKVIAFEADSLVVEYELRLTIATDGALSGPFFHIHPLRSYAVERLSISSSVG